MLEGIIGKCKISCGVSGAKGLIVKNKGKTRVGEDIAEWKTNATPSPTVCRRHAGLVRYKGREGRRGHARVICKGIPSS